MNPVSLFNRLWNSSSAPQVKVEQNSNAIEPQEETATNGAHDTEDMSGQEAGEETIHTDWEGFGDEELGGSESAIAPTSAEKPKKKKKKRKKKGKRESITAPGDVEADTSQLAASSSPHQNPPDVAGEFTTNGNVAEASMLGEPAVEDVPAPKLSRKTNGTTSKRKRASKSKAAVTAEELGASNGDDYPESGGLVSGASSGGSATHVKDRKSSQEAVEAELAASGIAGNTNGDTIPQASQDSRSPEASPESIKRKKAIKRRKVVAPAEKAPEVNEDARPSPEPQSQTQHFEYDAQAKEAEKFTPTSRVYPEYDFSEEDDADETPGQSAQLQQDLRSIPHPASDNGEDADDEPKRPSTKALGKRKAVEEPLSQKISKKSKRGEEKGSSGRDIRSFGFQLSDVASQSRRGSSSSNQSPTLLTDIARQVWEENNGIQKEPEPPSNSQTSVRSPKSSWNAVNHPVEPGTARSLFVSRQESPKHFDAEGFASNAGNLKHTRPVVEVWSAASTPSVARRPACNSSFKTPKPVKHEEVVGSATSTSKTLKTPKAEAITPKDKGIKASAPSTSKGKLSQNQFDALTSAVESYRESANLTDFQLNDRIHADAKDKLAQEMWKEICEEVPDVPRRNVMNTCRRNYYNFKRGPWEHYEDDELRKAHKKYPGKWKLIGEIMNRFPEDVRDRWRNYVVCGDSMKKSGWELGEEKRLREAVKQCIDETRKQSHSATDQPLDEESFIDWGKVSELMDRTRSRLQCRDKWLQLKGREEADEYDSAAEMPISGTWRMEAAALDARLFSPEEKLILLRAIRDTGAAQEGKIPWQTLKDELNGKGKRMAWKYCFRKLQECVPHHKDMEFKDVVAYLVDTFENAAPNEPAGFDLPIEIFASTQNTIKKEKRRKHISKYDEALPSSSSKRKSRGRKQAQDGDKDSAAAPVSSARRRTLRDRMLQEGDSQETATSHARSASADIAADVTQGFESIKRTPKSERKYVIRKSKRNKFLSEEKVFEDPSDETPVPEGASRDEMDLETEQGDNAADELVAEDDVDDEELPGYSSDEQEDHLRRNSGGSSDHNKSIGRYIAEDEANDEELPDQTGDEEYYDLRRNVEGSPDLVSPADESAAEEDVEDKELPGRLDDEEDYNFRRNFEGSPDLDTPVHGRSFNTEVDAPIRLNRFHDDEGPVSSGYVDMTDIPARLLRMESIEL